MVIVVAYYSKFDRVSEDFISFLNYAVEFYPIVFSYNGMLKNLEELDPRVNTLNYGREGYDLNCYLEGLNFVFENLSDRCFVFLNNSFEILDVKKVFNLVQLLNVNLLKYDFVGVTKSTEIKLHYQSYFFGLSLRNVDEDVVTKLQSICSCNYKLNRDEVINYFELKNIEMLEEFELNHHSVYKPNLLVRIFGYLNFLAGFGFIDNPMALIGLSTFNPSTFYKFDLNRRFGFRKIKSSTIVNKIKQL